MASDLHAFDPASDISDDDGDNDIFPKQGPSVQLQVTQLKFQSLARPVKLWVDASPGCGGIAWPAGQVLSRYLLSTRSASLRGKRIVELGSGTGLVGLVAGMLGAAVTVTDQAPLLSLMQRNVTLNNLDNTVRVAELDWANVVPDDLRHPDIVLAADCVYFEPAFPLLCATLMNIATRDTEILFCYKKRRKADKRFFSLLAKHFSWSHVDDDPDKASYEREGIHLYRLVKRGP